jgi:hypothetical protein
VVADCCKQRSELSEIHKMWPVCRVGDCELCKDDYAPRFVFTGEDKVEQRPKAFFGGDQ